MYLRVQCFCKFILAAMSRMAFQEGLGGRSEQGPVRRLPVLISGERGRQLNSMWGVSSRKKWADMGHVVEVELWAGWRSR